MTDHIRIKSRIKAGQRICITQLFVATLKVT